MLERVLKIDGGTAQLQVHQAVPNLLGLSIREHSLAFLPIRIVRHILEHIVVPEDAVFDELLVSEGSHSAAVLVCVELEDLTFDLHVNVVVEETLATEVPCHKDL